MPDFAAIEDSSPARGMVFPDLMISVGGWIAWGGGNGLSHGGRGGVGVRAWAAAACVGGSERAVCRDGTGGGAYYEIWSNVEGS